MSTLSPFDVACPACDAAFSFDVALIIDAAARPDHREAILEDQLQVQPCPACGFKVRAAPQFVYTDLPRRQWFLVEPSENLRDWRALEQTASGLFAERFGPGAPAAQAGEGMRPRLVFGWAALREKLICEEQGIADVPLELVKLSLIHSAPELDLSDGLELRLISAEDDALLFGWFDVLTDTVGETMELPRGALGAVLAPGWDALRQQLGGEGAVYTDVWRLFSADPEPAGA